MEIYHKVNTPTNINHNYHSSNQQVMSTSNILHDKQRITQNLNVFREWEAFDVTYFKCHNVMKLKVQFQAMDWANVILRQIITMIK
jgi:hypothetical protein